MDIKNSVSVVVGASSGLGEQVLRELAKRGSYPVASARSIDILESLADELGGKAVGFDASQTETYDSFLNSVLEIAQNKQAKDILFVYTSGIHEDPVIEEDGSYRYSKESDVSDDYQKTMQLVNVHAPKELIKGLHQFTHNIHFLYTSSQAADPEWWDKGNSIYGPQNKEIEEFLKETKHPDNVKVYTTRYPFIDTPMAHDLYHKLAHVDEFIRKHKASSKSPEDLFEPVEEVSESTVNLLHTGELLRFEQVSPIIYNYKS
jgi:NADP-dependent 3-hydroxy acid dehydrogenase YdfG